MRWRQRAAALVEFALAWPIALLIVFATVESAVWAAETYAARAATLAGARAGSVAGGTSDVAAQVARQALASGLVGVTPRVWCPGSAPRAPAVWVCAMDRGNAIEVDVGGSVPALVPLFAGRGLPIRAQVVIQKETFAP
jgi:Flp pilus assembly protein TadG